MTNQSHARAFLDQLYGAMNRGDLDAFDGLIADDYVDHTDGLRGPAAFKQRIAAFRAAFPDLQVTIDEVIADGETFASRTTITGTHTGPLMGIPPTGRRVRVGGVDLGRIRSGKAQERWGGADTFSLLQQLGVLGQPAP
jgi:steroid delta-isomerase-like uncharacterized protein